MIVWLDDDATFLRIFSEDIELEGIELKKFTNADEFIEFYTAEKNSIKVIIMDIMMKTGRILDSSVAKHGILTGLKILQDIVDIKRHKIIILTQYNDAEVNTWASDNNVEIIAKQKLTSDWICEKVQKYGA